MTDRGAYRQPTYDPKKTGRTVVISLNDPQVDGSSELIGADPGKKQLRETVIPTFVPPESGATAEEVSKAGRADDFAWPPAAALPSAEPVLVRRN